MAPRGRRRHRSPATPAPRHGLSPSPPAVICRADLRSRESISLRNWNLRWPWPSPAAISIVPASCAIRLKPWAATAKNRAPEPRRDSIRLAAGPGPPASPSGRRRHTGRTCSRRGDHPGVSDRCGAPAGAWAGSQTEKQRRWSGSADHNVADAALINATRAWRRLIVYNAPVLAVHSIQLQLQCCRARLRNHGAETDAAANPAWGCSRFSSPGDPRGGPLFCSAPIVLHRFVAAAPQHLTACGASAAALPPQRIVLQAAVIARRTAALPVPSAPAERARCWARHP